jgi:RNA polymerase sigma-70 factor (ECF subfamily)
MKRSDTSKLLKPLFESWAPYLLRYAIRFTGSRELSEDFVQEAFMSLHRKLCSGAEIQNPKGWTLRAVRNQIHTYRRDRRRLGVTVNPSVLDEVPGAEDEVDLMPAGVGSVTELFSVLTEREEQVMLLRLHELKYRQIADELEISPNTVGVLIARALRKLQQAAKSKSNEKGIAGRPARNATQRVH